MTRFITLKVKILQHNSTGLKNSFSLPRFNRVRVVEIFQQEEGEESVATYKCSCNFTVQWGMPCRHIVFLTRQHLSLQQFDVQWLEFYPNIPVEDVFSLHSSLPVKVNCEVPDEENLWVSQVEPPDDLLTPWQGVSLGEDDADVSDISSQNIISQLD